MSLLTLQNAQLAFGDAPLLDGIEFNILAGERVCIVGRNGAGKSTLMKVIAGELQLDDGRRQLLQGINIARLEQDPPKVDDDQTVFDYVAGGLAEMGTLLKKYHHQLDVVGHDCSEKAMNELMRLQEQVEAVNGWAFDTRINQSLTLLELNGDTRLNDLSGGWLRKVALARALTNDPDILLLDGWKLSCWILKVPSCSSVTTVPLSVRWPPVLWIWIAASFPAGRAITTIT